MAWDIGTLIREPNDRHILIYRITGIISTDKDECVYQIKDMEDGTVFQALSSQLEYYRDKVITEEQLCKIRLES